MPESLKLQGSEGLKYLQSVISDLSDCPLKPSHNLWESLLSSLLPREKLQGLPFL